MRDPHLRGSRILHWILTAPRGPIRYTPAVPGERHPAAIPISIPTLHIPPTSTPETTMPLRTFSIALAALSLLVITGCEAASVTRSEAAPVAPSEATEHDTLAKPGFVTHIEDGRLWVFRAGSPELAAFEQAGELAKHVIRPGAGPGGMTIKAPDIETLQAYLAAKEGFVTRMEDGRVWVFIEGSSELAAFEKHGELAKHVIRPGAGPAGMTVKAPDVETLQSYLYAKPGFATKIEDGRLWVFRAGSPELAAYEKAGELAKHVVRPGGGPGGITIKAPDTDVMRDYLLRVPGFVTRIDDGRAWVFRVGSEEWAAFQKHGELAKHVVRPGAGPGGMTMKAPSVEVLDRFLAELR